MDQTIPAFANFPQDDQLWRLDVFGEYLRNEQVPSDPLIQIVLSPVVPSAAKRFGLDSPKAVNSAKQQTCLVSSGYLPYLRRYSLWRDGAKEEAAEFGELAVVEFKNVLVSEETIRILPANMKLGDRQYLIPPHQHLFGKIGLRTKLLAIDADGVKNRILIDTTEAARMWYLNSTWLTKSLLWGHITPENNVVFVEGSLELGDDGTASIELHHNSPRTDGWIVLRLAHSDYARKQALRIHDSLKREKINGNPVVPDVYPPFLGTTTLKVCGKWITSCGDKRFLAHWIVSCSHPFPASRLTVRKDGDDQPEAEFDPTLPGHPANRLYVPKRLIPNGETKFRSDTEPKKPMRRTSILLNDARFPDLEGKPLIRPSGDPIGVRAVRPAPTLEDMDIKDLSTGEGTYGDTDAAPVSIGGASTRVQDEKEKNTVKRRPACPPGFESVQNAIAELRALGDVGVRFVSLPGDAEGECAENACLFPWQDKQGKRLKWSFIHRRRRQALVAELQRGGSYFYLLEAERRDSEHYTTLFLCRRDMTALSDQMVQGALRLCAEHDGKWFETEASDLHRHKLKHTWPTPDEFAQRLLAEMSVARAKPKRRAEPTDTAERQQTAQHG